MITSNLAQLTQSAPVARRNPVFDYILRTGPFGVITNSWAGQSAFSTLQQHNENLLGRKRNYSTQVKYEYKQEPDDPLRRPISADRPVKRIKNEDSAKTYGGAWQAYASLPTKRRRRPSRSAHPV